MIERAASAAGFGQAEMMVGGEAEVAAVPLMGDEDLEVRTLLPGWRGCLILR